MPAAEVKLAITTAAGPPDNKEPPLTETLSHAEMAQLLESSGGLVPLKGKWVEVDAAKLNEALAHWKRVEKNVRAEGISFFEGMRLLSGAKLPATDGRGVEAVGFQISIEPPDQRADTLLRDALLLGERVELMTYLGQFAALQRDANRVISMAWFGMR